MANKFWFGFGHVKFTKNGITAGFEDGRGVVSFEPIFSVFEEDAEFGIISLMPGFRSEFFITNLVNVRDNDYLQYQYMANILNKLVSDTKQETMKVYPVVDSSIDTGLQLQYNVVLAPGSKISPRHDHNVQTWQTLALHLIGITKVVSIPTVVGSPRTRYIVDGTGRYITDAAGNKIIAADG